MAYLNCQFCGVIVERRNRSLTPTCFKCGEFLGKLAYLKRKIRKKEKALKGTKDKEKRLKLERILAVYRYQDLTLRKRMGYTG